MNSIYRWLVFLLIAVFCPTSCDTPGTGIDTNNPEVVYIKRFVIEGGTGIHVVRVADGLRLSYVIRTRYPANSIISWIKGKMNDIDLIDFYQPNGFDKRKWQGNPKKISKSTYIFDYYWAASWTTKGTDKMFVSILSYKSKKKFGVGDIFGPEPLPDNDNLTISIMMMKPIVLPSGKSTKSIKEESVRSVSPRPMGPQHSNTSEGK